MCVFRWMAPGAYLQGDSDNGPWMWHQIARFNRPKRTEQRNNYRLGMPRKQLIFFYDLNGFEFSPYRFLSS